MSKPLRRIRWRWLVLGLCAITLAASAELLRRTITSSGDEFTRYVGIANVAAVLVGVAAIVVAVLPMLGVPRPRHATSGEIAELVRRIAAVNRTVQGNELRELLLGTNDGKLITINLTFRRNIVQYRHAGGEEHGDLRTVGAYFAGLRPRRLVILGDAGAGKTVLALELLRQLNDADATLVPVHVSLTRFDPDQTFEHWLRDELVEQFDLTRREARLLIGGGHVLPVLDGLDEMDDGAVPSRAERAVACINRVLDAGDAGPAIVTCRADRYAALPVSIRDATAVEIQPLQPRQIEQHLMQHVADETEELAWLEVLTELRDRPTGITARQLAEVLSTPWMVTLALTVSRDDTRARDIFFAGDEVRQPADVKDFLLRRYVKAAITSRDRTGGHYDPDKVIDWLRTIAETAGHPSTTDIALHTWGRTVEQRHAPRLAVLHGALSGLAVLAGIMIVLLSVLGQGVLGWRRIVDYLASPTRLEPTFLGAMLVVLVGILVLPLLAARLASARQPQPSRFRVGRLRTRRGWRSLVLGTLVGVATGLVGGGAIGLASGLALGLRLALPIGAVGGGVAGFAFGVVFGADRGLLPSIGPRRVIRGDLLHGIALGTTIGTVGGLAATVAIGVQFGIAVGIVTAVVCAVVVGPVTAIRYLLAVAVMSRTAGLPFRFARFLDWTVDIGLLRVAGVSYQLRHRELSDWLRHSTAAR